MAYSDRTETEQDTIGVEVFTNAIGDAEIVQKLLEQRPRTIAQAYDIAHRYETTKRAALHVTNLMHSGARCIPEWRSRAAVIRQGPEEEEVETTATLLVARWKPSPNHPPRRNQGRKGIKWEEIRCHNCSGLGHMRRNCPSPKKMTRAQASITSHETSESAVLHFKAQSQEMSIHMLVHELEMCAVLDSGARRSVLPLRQYNAIHPDVRPPLQPSTVKTLLGVGPGDVPVLGEAHFPVQINNHQVSVHFLVADIAGDEALSGHPFLTQAQARLDFGNHRIVLFGEEVTISTQSKPKAHAVRVARTVVLEPGQEYLVRGNSHFREPVKGEVVLSPTKGFVEKHKVLVARILVEAQPLKTVPLRIFNPGNSAVTIKEGAIAGFLHPATILQTTETTTQPEQVANNSPIIPKHLQELYAQSSTELTTEEQLQLAQLLCTYDSVFSTGPNDLGCTSLVQRRMAWEKQQNADQQIQQSLEAGLACRSHSSWASPIVMVRKKDGTYRLCIDYRALNDCTVKDAYPLPRIQDTLATLSTAKWFSTLDLAAGYWQVELTPRARKAAAFCTRNGLFERNVMPFGLCNAPATFQRLMDRVLAGMQWETCLVYLDDIIVLGRDVSEMLEQLGQVFNRLHQANLKLKPAKCYLFRRQVAYLGHIVSEGAVATDPGKVQKVQDWPTPTSLQEVIL